MEVFMIAVGTRFFDKREGAGAEKVVTFVKRAATLGDMVMVAVNSAEDKSGAEGALRKLALPNLPIEVIPVMPWGFTAAMNALVFAADVAQQDFLLSHSVEIEMTKAMVDEMMKSMEPDTLCVGARLSGHDFCPNKTFKGNGKTIPWNTCCIWRVETLATLGFPLVGDASFDRSQAGVEEFTLFALAQHLYPGKTKVKLVEISSIEWKTEFANDSARRQAHERKMRLKVQRPRIQLGLLGLPEPLVEHIASEKK
jgi:hypothetical protein